MPKQVLLITNADLILPDDTRLRGWLRTDNDTIHSLGAGQPPTVDVSHTVIDAGGLALVPGLIDTHIHGMRGADTMDAIPDALHAISRTLVKHGVTGWLPT